MIGPATPPNHSAGNCEPPKSSWFRPVFYWELGWRWVGHSPGHSRGQQRQPPNPVGGLTLARVRRHTPRIVSSTWTARVVATAVTLAVALAGLLPDVHRHVDDDHAVVHQHVIGGDEDHHAEDHHDEVATGGQIGADFADHTNAQFLTASSELARPFAGIAFPPGARPVVAPPTLDPAASCRRSTMLPTHDPPLRFTSSPAPPAVV